MSVGPPDEIDDDVVGPDDAAKPTKPSERGAWRHKGQLPADAGGALPDRPRSSDQEQ